MKFLAKTYIWVKNRFENVWNDNYPLWWHFVDLFGGLTAAIIFVSYPESRDQYSTGTLVGLFFAIVVIGYIIMWAFTYGVVRSRNAWTKKRK